MCRSGHPYNYEDIKPGICSGGCQCFYRRPPAPPPYIPPPAPVRVAPPPPAPVPVIQPPPVQERGRPNFLFIFRFFLSGSSYDLIKYLYLF